MFAPSFAERLRASHGSLRSVVAEGALAASRRRRWPRRSAIST